MKLCASFLSQLRLPRDPPGCWAGCGCQERLGGLWLPAAAGGFFPQPPREGFFPFSKQWHVLAPVQAQPAALGSWDAPCPECLHTEWGKKSMWGNSYHMGGQSWAVHGSRVPGKHTQEGGEGYSSERQMGEGLMLQAKYAGQAKPEN